jgi:hypothetical protein
MAHAAAGFGAPGHLAPWTWLQVQRVAGNFHVTVSMEDFFMLEETQVCKHSMT